MITRTLKLVGQLRPKIAAVVLAVCFATGNPMAHAQSTGGIVYAWGANGRGQLGDGTIIGRAQPVEVSGLNDIVEVASGLYHSLALTASGRVFAWGSDSYGQLGVGGFTDSLVPRAVPGLFGVTSIDAGTWHSLALLNDGTMRAWGYNTWGSVGDNSTENRQTPVNVPGLASVRAISSGDHSSFAILANGSVWAWGWNALYGLGDGTRIDRRSPVQIPPLSTARLLCGGDLVSFAVLADGSVWWWGSVTNSPSPVRLNLPAGTPPIVSVSAGSDHVLLALQSGVVLAKGGNASGQLGTGANPTSVGSFVVVPGLSNIVQVEALDESSFALSRDGRLWAWGKGGGVLGLGDTNARPTPSEVPSPRPGYRFSSIAGNDFFGGHVVAILVPVASVCCRGTTCAVVAPSVCTAPLGVGARAFTDAACGTNMIAPCCFADFDKDGQRSLDDLFAYIAAWFDPARSGFARIDGDGVQSPAIEDVFVYIQLWFSGCQ